MDANPYGAILLAWLERYRTYPRIARMKGLEGTVRVKLRLARDGSVLDSAIPHGSGEEILDEAVRDLIRRADRLFLEVTGDLNSVMPSRPSPSDKN